MEQTKEKTCCFFGHREIEDTAELRSRLSTVIEAFIGEGIDTFLFGSKSEFNSLCYELVSTLKKEKYPHIKRIYVRAEYPNINEEYLSYLLKSYEDTYYPDHIISSGRAAYVERNYEMINKSQYCIIYYLEPNAPTTRKSGTKIALDYAKGKNKTVFNVAI